MRQTEIIRSELEQLKQSIHRVLTASGTPRHQSRAFGSDTITLTLRLDLFDERLLEAHFGELEQLMARYRDLRKEEDQALFRIEQDRAVKSGLLPPSKHPLT